MSSATTIPLTSFAAKISSSAIETWQVAGLDITLAAPRKCSIDYHHECRNINLSRNDSQTPLCRVCTLQFVHTDRVAFDNRIFFWSFAGY